MLAMSGRGVAKSKGALYEIPTIVKKKYKKINRVDYKILNTGDTESLNQ